MTRLFLAAGVAALAIASAADAKPGGNGGGHGNGGGGGQQAEQQHGNGGGGGGQLQRGGGGGGGGRQFQVMQQGGGHGGGGLERQQMRQMQRAERPQRMERQQFRMERQAQNRGFERQQMRAQRQQMRMERQAQNRGFERQQMRAQHQQMRMERQAQNRGLERQQLRAERMQQAQNRNLERQQMRMNRMQQAQNGKFDRQQFRNQQFAQAQNGFDRQQLRENRRQMLQQQALASQQFYAQRFNGGPAKFDDSSRDYWRSQQQSYQQALLGTSFAPLYYGANTQVLAPTIVQNFIGVPVNQLNGFASLNPFPASLDYLYPSTPDYYYRYGDGYAYQIDRGSNLIAALIPLLAGGYLPGQYLPQPYMASYVPDYYGFNSFYPDYGDTCNRYANGVIYEVDCYSGMVEDVIPMYAGGYGVGQMLPTSYAYYNVPQQYRTLYYDTPDYNYWYAPGAIYQYEPRTSMITSVAALLSPGFTVGQALPVGYDVYNVPYDYRATYYDTPNAWYRYNNGYIYQVDPVTRLVTSIVASILT